MTITYAGHVQEHVQRAILLLIDQTGRARPEAVFARCPRTDERDMTRAYEVLVAEGSLDRLEVGSAQARHTITEIGQQRLAAF
jgi:hypothetical protein